jgi:hypothetical protein
MGADTSQATHTAVEAIEIKGTSAAFWKPKLHLDRPSFDLANDLKLADANHRCDDHEWDIISLSLK